MDTQTPNLEAISETTLPGGCVVCGGDLHLKVVQGHATSYCSKCHWLSHPLLSVRHDGLQVLYKPAAAA